VRTEIVLDYSGVAEVDHKAGEQVMDRQRVSRFGVTALGRSPQGTTQV
jgi:hypothetical protein